jgi:hypothetical protein
MQVVVAVLLDNFTAAADEEKQRKAQVLGTRQEHVRYTLGNNARPRYDKRDLV